MLVKFPRCEDSFLKYECFDSNCIVQWCFRGPKVLFVISTAINPVNLHLLENQARHMHHKMHLWSDTCSTIESLKVMVVILNLCGRDTSSGEISGASRMSTMSSSRRKVCQCSSPTGTHCPTITGSRRPKSHI